MSHLGNRYTFYLNYNHGYHVNVEEKKNLLQERPLMVRIFLKEIKIKKVIFQTNKISCYYLIFLNFIFLNLTYR